MRECPKRRSTRQPPTHSVAEVCKLIGCESEDWFIDRLRDGTFPTRRIVRQLRFSDEDPHHRGVRHRVADARAAAGAH